MYLSRAEWYTNFKDSTAFYSITIQYLANTNDPSHIQLVICLKWQVYNIKVCNIRKGVYNTLPKHSA